MERPDMASLTCVNPECQMFDQPGRGNLKVRKVYGQDQLRFLRCKECGEEFSERRGSALFNTKIPEAKAMSVIEHLDEGCTLTGTARLVKVAKDTVSRLLKVTGRHAKKFHDQEVQGITPQALEFDEQWSYVGKKGEALHPEEEEYGDTWDHVAIDPTSKLVVSLEVGERTQEQTMTLVKDAQSHLAPDCLPAIFTDAYEAYPQAILETFGNRYPVPRQGATGRRPKPKLRCSQRLVYAQVKKHYKGGRVEWVETRPIFGKGKLLTILEKLGWTKVNTSAVERYNGTSRQRDRRKARKTLAFSRESRYHRWMSWLSTTMYNFCHSHRSLKQERGSEVQHRSPAMAAGLTDHIWSVRKRMLCPVLGRG